MRFWCKIFCAVFIYFLTINNFFIKGEENMSVFIQNYTINEYNASCQNWGLAVSPDGILYVANNSGLLAFNGNSWKLYKMPDNSAIYKINYKDNRIYTGGETTDGFWTKDEFGEMNFTPYEGKYPDTIFNKTYREVNIPKEIEDCKTSVLATSKNLNFIGTETDGLYITNNDNKIIYHISTQNQLQDNVVRDICVQDESLIWLALDNGITQIDINPPLFMLGRRSVIGQLQQAKLKDDILIIKTNRGYFKRTLKPNDVFVPTENEDTTELLQTVGNENNRISDFTFYQSESETILLNPQAIYNASEDLYWIINNNEAGLIDFDESNKTILKCRFLFDNYNLNLATRGQQIISLNDSLSAVSTMQGAFLLDTRKIISNSISLTMPSFSQVNYVDKRGIHQLQPDTNFISLPYNFQELNIFVETTIFTPNHQFSYKLEGVSAGWSKWQNDGKISFLQLPEGTYELKVRKYVTKGPFPEISMIIEVRPPWYNTIWAYIIYILILWLIIQSALRYHLRNLNKEEMAQKEKEKQLEERKLEQLKNEMLEKELQNKNNELTLQTSALVKRNQATQAILDEFEKQKELLGDRYPNKMYNKLHALMEDALENQADWLLFESYFNSAHQNFLDRLKTRFPDITTGDLRVCCLLRMNLSTKEIASLMNVSVRAIELRRYRLRKRLELDNETNLVDFLMKF